MINDYGQLGPTKRGGGKTASLFWIIGGIAVIAYAVWLGSMLSYRDTLARYVPANAVFYGHMNGEAYAEAIFGTDASAAQKDLHPDEAALFAVTAEDGSLAWTDMLGWRKMPSTEVAAGAERLGCKMLANGRSCAFGEIASSTEESILADYDISSRLAALRKTAPMQAYLLAPGLFLPAGVIPFAPGSLFLSGSSGKDGFSFVAHTATQFDRLSMMLGPKARASGDSALSSLRVLPDADVVLGGASDPAMLFDAYFRNSAKTVVSDSQSQKALLFSFRTTGGHNAYYAHVGVPLEESVRMIGNAYAAATPFTRPFALPDKEYIGELRINRDRIDIDAWSEPEKEVKSLNQGGETVSAVLRDTHDRSITASSIAILHTGIELSSAYPQFKKCDSSLYSSLFIVRSPQFQGVIPRVVHKFSSLEDMRALFIGITDDSEIHICGY